MLSTARGCGHGILLWPDSPTGYCNNSAPNEQLVTAAAASSPTKNVNPGSAHHRDKADAGQTDTVVEDGMIAVQLLSRRSLNNKPTEKSHQRGHKSPLEPVHFCNDLLAGKLLAPAIWVPEDEGEHVTLANGGFFFLYAAANGSGSDCTLSI